MDHLVTHGLNENKDLAKEFIDIRLSLNFSSESHMSAHNKEFYYSLLEG
jgi:hypothetical protein